MADISSNLPVNDTSDGTLGSAAPTIGQQAAGTDGTNLRAISVDSTGKLNINNVSGTVSLPSGASTSALQTSGNSSLTSIATNTGSAVTNQTNASQKTQVVDGSGNTITSTLINSKQRLDVNLPSGGVTGSSVPFDANYVGGQDSAGNLAQLRIPSIDSGNSTSATLTSGSTFTGTWKDVSGYSTLSILVFTDQVSATDGLVIEVSTNGTNVDDNDMYTIAASNGQQISLALVGQYYRVRYTNGGTNQGAFRLQAKLHTGAPKSSSYRVGMGIGNGEQDVEAVMNVNGRLPLTASSPATVSAGVSSGTLIAANTSRKGLVVTNTSSLGTISLNLANGSAVLNSGITLYPHDVWYMDEWTFTTAQINVIASLAATSVALQELT